MFEANEAAQPFLKYFGWPNHLEPSNGPTPNQLNKIIEVIWPTKMLGSPRPDQWVKNGSK